MNAPGSVTILRSNDNLNVICKKEGYEEGRASVVSATKPSMFGNLLFGGGIGAIVDYKNGSAYEYPNILDVIMGISITIDQIQKQDQEAPK